MSLASVVVIPAAPVLVPGASPAQPRPYVRAVEELRTDVDAALDTLPATGSILLLACGEETLVVDAPLASLASYGLPQVARSCHIDRALISSISARGQVPRVRSDRLDGDLAVLSLLVGARRPDVTLAPVVVPFRADVAGLRGIATGLASALGSVEHPVAVVAAGDLAATLREDSPGYLVEGAQEWDRAVVQAMRELDLTELGDLGPDDAGHFQARGWAPLTVATALASDTGRGFAELSYVAPRGVGQLVAC